MRLLLAFCLSLFGLSNPVLFCQVTNSTNRQRFVSAGSSAYLRQSDKAFVTNNNVFEFVNLLHDDGNGYTRLLLLKTIHNEHIDGRDETKGNVTVQAWTIAPNGSHSQRWRFSAPGNNGGALSEDRFFRATEWGCCDWPSVSWYYSLVSGKRLYVSNSDVLSISATDGGPQFARYVAFGYRAHGTPPILQYGSDSKVRQRYSVIAPADYYEPPEVFISIDKEPVRSLVLRRPFSFIVLLRYKDGVELHIPVEDDALRPEKATLPKGYSLRPENAD